MKITAFLPCRKGSARVPRKNIRPFGECEFGLIELKLRHLLVTEAIDSVVLSTNDDEILEYASSIKSKKLFIHVRSEHLSSSETSTDELIGHALSLIPEGHILWTHVTSPFVDESSYMDMINCYKLKLNEGFDSLVSVTPLQGFIWNNDGPLNYDRSVEKWPRTQTIQTLYEINSAVFLNSVENYIQYNDRIGKRPFLYKLDKIKGLDIDWEEDFVMAEYLLSHVM